MSHRYSITLAVLWVAGFIAAPFYLEAKEIPWRLGGPAAMAVLLEASLYLSLAFEETRSRWRWQWVALLAPAPYLLYTLPAGQASAASAAVLMLMAAAAAAWFRWAGRNRLADFAFVGFVSAPVVFKLFKLIYPEAAPGMRLEVLGQLMWIRAGIVAVLQHRMQKGVNFGFWPSKVEWVAGARWFLYALPVVLGLTLWSGFARFEIPDKQWWVVAGSAAGTFLGILLVVALSEEFFFRGLLQQWVEEISGRAWVGVALASLLFGAAHLGFRVFPNWKFAALAAVAGLFYGLAFRAGNGIRAAMVTHALMVTVWRTLFR